MKRATSVKSRLVLLLISLGTLLLPAHIGAEQNDIDLKATISTLLDRKAIFAKFSTPRFYEENSFSPAWQDGGLHELIQTIKNSAEHGLEPSDYHLHDLTAGVLNSRERDVIATDAFLTLGGHLLGGKVNPVTVEPTWTVKGREIDLVTYLMQALQHENVQESLESLAPQQPGYLVLKKALAHFKDIAASGGWKEVSDGPIIRPGSESERVEEVRARLLATGEFADEEGADPRYYDEKLVSAVKKFQRRANLEPDGIIGSATLGKMNCLVQEQIETIRVNMERWRWLPEDLGQKHIRVNIANYELEAHEGLEIARKHEVIVGKTYRQTPIFSAKINHLVLNPWWEVPATLARIDILPKFQKDREMVTQLGYHVLDQQGRLLSQADIDWRSYSPRNFPYRLRQKPGPSNALGQVKFMLPNEHAVYLHDSPSRELFAKTRRDFSSGCIRVRNPIDLADWILEANKDWPRSRIDKVLETGKDTTIRLSKHIPVHLLYWTVIVDEESDGVRFIDDVYARDDRVLESLNRVPEKSS